MDLVPNPMFLFSFIFIHFEVTQRPELTKIGYLYRRLLVEVGYQQVGIGLWLAEG